MEKILQILKYLFILVGVISAVLALTKNAIDKENNITPDGNKLLILIIASAILSIITQAIEYRIDLKKESENNHRNESILRQNKTIS